MNNNSICFIKTHSTLEAVNGNQFTDLKNSLGAIYIVRDPRNVVTSVAHHYQLSENEVLGDDFNVEEELESTQNGGLIDMEPIEEDN